MATKAYFARSNHSFRKRQLFAATTTAILCAVGVSIDANAIFLNPHGLGEALVYPYYTVNGGNSTVITLLNTTPEGKAVKVRFLEGYNGRDVLDFDLYLSPFDIWTGQVLPVGSGAGLFTNDNSCTVPKLPTSSTSALAFSTQNFDGTSTQGKDGGPTDVSRTKEGYIEVIEMGRVLNTTKNTLDAITHSAGVPANCAQLVSAWSDSGYWHSAAMTDFGAPDGGLAGTGTIVNVALGTVEAYVPDAVAQFYGPGTPGLHTAPDSLIPNLSSATSLTSATDPNDVPISATFKNGADAVSSIFMADAIVNEYWTSGSIAASSEWEITYPTKRFYTDSYYVDATAQPPFDVVFSALSALPQGAGSCAPVGVAEYDREEATAASVEGGGPLPVFGNALCFASQIVTFNQTLTPSEIPGAGQTKILSSNLTGNLTTGFENGWTMLDLYGQSPANHTLSDASGSRFFQGQPITGFWVTQFINGNVGGVLANYTALYAHKTHVQCVTTSAGAIPCS
jgi:hypothetical protein